MILTTVNFFQKLLFYISFLLIHIWKLIDKFFCWRPHLLFPDIFVIRFLVSLPISSTSSFSSYLSDKFRFSLMYVFTSLHQTLSHILHLYKEMGALSLLYYYFFLFFSLFILFSFISSYFSFPVSQKSHLKEGPGVM